MKKRLLPIPLILLIPIVLLIIVTIAGIYRFSLSDEEILAKFPQQASQQDSVVASVFGLRTPNPWTVKVPDSSEFTFIEKIESEQYALGQYANGEERGTVTFDLERMTKVDASTYAGVLTVSNQGSGVFYYLALSKYDEFRQRMVTKEAVLLGDRIKVNQVAMKGQLISVELLERDENQAMAQEPTKLTTILFQVTEQDSLEQQ